MGSGGNAAERLPETSRILSSWSPNVGPGPCWTRALRRSDRAPRFEGVRAPERPPEACPRGAGERLATPPRLNKRGSLRATRSGEHPPRSGGRVHWRGSHPYARYVKSGSDPFAVSAWSTRKWWWPGRAHHISRTSGRGLGATESVGPITNYGRECYGPHEALWRWDSRIY